MEVENVKTHERTHSSVLLPESESFWSPLAPAVKGSFLLGAFSFISLTPSLRSNLGVLFDNTLSCEGDKSEHFKWHGLERTQLFFKIWVKLKYELAEEDHSPIVGAILCLFSFCYYGLCRPENFSMEFPPRFLAPPATAQRARRGERRLSWRRLGSVVYSCWKQSPARVYLLSTDANTSKFSPFLCIESW